MRVTPIPAGTRLVDTAETLTDAVLDSIAAHRDPDGGKIDGIATYIPFAQQTNVGGCIRRDRVEAAHARGLGVLFVQHVRLPGQWRPSYELGSADGLAVVTWLRSEQLLLEGVSVFYDLEGPAAGTKAADCMAYDRGHTDITTRLQILPGAYLGYDVPLDAAARWELQVVRYWVAPGGLEPSVCGACIRQLLPYDQKMGAATVDRDLVTADKLGRLPTWLVG